MLRSLSKALILAAFFACTPGVANATSPAVAKEIEETRTQLPSVIEFRRRDVDRLLVPTEKLLANWEKFAARKGISAEDQADIDKTTVEILYTLGHAYIEAGNLAAAEPHILRALGPAAKLGPAGNLEAGFAFAIAGKLRRLQGNYQEANQFLERALSIHKNQLVAYWGVTVLMFELAQMRKIRGDFKGARELLLELDRSVMNEAAKSERAAVDLVAGEYTPIEELLKPAMGRLRDVSLVDPSIVTSLGHLADYHLILGSPERAEEAAKDLLARREKMPMPSQFDIADAVIRLARVYVALGDIDHAAALVERAAKILNTITLEAHPRRIPLLVVQAELMLKRNDLPAAEKLFFLAHANATKSLGAENYETAIILARLGAVQLARHDHQAAYTSCSRASETLEKTLGLLHPETSAALDDLARVYMAQGKSAQALPVLRKAMDNRDRHAARIFGFVSEMQKTRTMERLRPETELAMRLASALPNNEDAVKLALTAVLRRKGRVLDGMAIGRAALRDANSPDEMILMDQIISLQRQIVALIIRGPQGRTPDEHRATIRELDAQKQMLEAQESRMSQRRLLQDNPVTVDEVAAALPKGSALVEYSRLPSSEGEGASHYVAWVLFPDSTVQFVEIGDAAGIDALVAQARAAFADSKVDPKPPARKLDAAIMQPVRRVLGKTQWLFVSPDGDLNLVPFGALRDEFEHWLLDAYSFTYLTSGRDLLLGETIDTPEEAGAPAIFIGNPEFGEKKLGRRRFAQRDNEAPARGARAADLLRIKFTPLDGTAAEIAAIEKKVPGAQVFLGDKATEAQVKAIKHPRILHLATHGFFLPDKPSATNPDEDAAAFRTDNPLVRAGLAFSGANLLRSGDEDGVLTAFEAAGLDLYGTKLVVLSACETGVGEARSGEGVYGLRRALAIAGAETTVMSLWQVDDIGTRDLMVGYYERLIAGGGRSESLRQAALALKAHAGYEHPFYWASFIVSGDGTALSGKQSPPAPSPVTPGPRGCACEVPAAGDSAGSFPPALWLLASIAAMRRLRQRDCVRRT